MSVPSLIVYMDTKYVEVCELCGGKKVKIYDWLICIECHKKYMRHKDLYGYAKEEDILCPDKLV